MNWQELMYESWLNDMLDGVDSMNVEDVADVIADRDEHLAIVSAHDPELAMRLRRWLDASDAIDEHLRVRYADRIAKRIAENEADGDEGGVG